MRLVDAAMAKKLQGRKEQQALRSLKVGEGQIDFCSNDYLGFSRNAHLQKLVAQRSESASLGSTGSRLISGHSHLAEDLERQIAHFHQAEAALLFNSGYTANLGLLASVAQRSDTILYDRLAHASIREGVQLALAKSFSFEHNDPQSLKKKLQKAEGNIFVVVESIYSMDGDEAPLLDFLEVMQDFPAVLIVDEAHATGVFGEKGEGIVVEKGLTKVVWARVHTYGKALGGHGATVVGSELLKQYLLNFARSFIYTTALPAHSLHCIQAAYEELETTPNLQLLHKKIAFFQQLLSPAIRASFIPSRSPIQSLLCPGNERVKNLASQLQQEGFDIRAILHPTVPKGSERLRICLHAFNSKKEIQQLTRTLNLIL